MIKSYGFWFLDNDYKCYKKEMSRAEFNKIELFYSHKLKKWVSEDEYLNDGSTLHWYPSGFPCRSLKSALRHLRNHNEIPKGTKFRLVSKFIGFDIYLTKK